MSLIVVGAVTESNHPSASRTHVLTRSRLFAIRIPFLLAWYRRVGVSHAWKRGVHSVHTVEIRVRVIRTLQSLRRDDVGQEVQQL